MIYLPAKTYFLKCSTSASYLVIYKPSRVSSFSHFIIAPVSTPLNSNSTVLYHRSSSTLIPHQHYPTILLDTLRLQILHHIVRAHNRLAQKEHRRHGVQKFHRKLLRLPAVEPVGANHFTAKVERQQIDRNLINLRVLHPEVVPVGGLQPVEPVPIGVRFGLGLPQRDRPLNVVTVKAHIDFVRIRRQRLQLDGILQRIVIQPIADADVLELIDHVPEDGFELIQTARRSVPPQVRVERLRVVHLADAALRLLLAPVEADFRQQRNGLIVMLEALDQFPLGKFGLVIKVVFVHHLFDLQLAIERSELVLTQIAPLGLGVVRGEQFFAVLERCIQKDFLE